MRNKIIPPMAVANSSQAGGSGTLNGWAKGEIGVPSMTASGEVWLSVSSTQSYRPPPGGQAAGDGLVGRIEGPTAAPGAFGLKLAASASSLWKLLLPWSKPAVSVVPSTKSYAY